MSYTAEPWRTDEQISLDLGEIMIYHQEEKGQTIVAGAARIEDARAIAEAPNLISLMADLVAGEDVEPIRREARDALRRIFDDVK